jgi:hypothetical protein
MDPETKELRAFDEAAARRVKSETAGKNRRRGRGDAGAEENPPPPILYDLTSLQRDANRLLGHPAARR